MPAVTNHLRAFFDGPRLATVATRRPDGALATDASRRPFLPLTTRACRGAGRVATVASTAADPCRVGPAEWPPARHPVASPPHQRRALRSTA